MTIWRVRIVCWIPKAINTKAEYVILMAFAQQQWLQERSSVLPYTYIACIVTRGHLKTEAFNGRSLIPGSIPGPCLRFVVGESALWQYLCCHSANSSMLTAHFNVSITFTSRYSVRKTDIHVCVEWRAGNLSSLCLPFRLWTICTKLNASVEACSRSSAQDISTTLSVVFIQ